MFFVVLLLLCVNRFFARVFGRSCKEDDYFDDGHDDGDIERHYKNSLHLLVGHSDTQAWAFGDSARATFEGVEEHYRYEHGHCAEARY